MLHFLPSFDFRTMTRVHFYEPHSYPYLINRLPFTEIKSNSSLLYFVAGFIFLELIIFLSFFVAMNAKLNNNSNILHFWLFKFLESSLPTIIFLLGWLEKIVEILHNRKFVRWKRNVECPMIRLERMRLSSLPFYKLSLINRI